jgi:integral membrane protein MviN
MGKYNVRRAAALLMFVTIIEKVLGFGREMVVASQFGANGITDAYFAGYLIPNFIMVLLNAGLVNVYAPIFLTEWEFDRDEAWKKINSISTYLIVLLFAVTCIGAIISPYIVKLFYPGFDGQKFNATVTIARLFFIGVFVYSIAIIEGSILNCFRHFIYSAISVALLSAGMIAGVIAFGGRTNINSIAYGYYAGAVAALLMQYLKIRQMGGELKPNFRIYSDFNSKFLRLLFPVLVATSMSQVNVFVDKVFASHLPDGSMSYINYADKVTQLPIFVFSGIIATVIFPDLIEYINNKDYKNLKVYFNRAIITTMMFLIPSYVGLTVLSNGIIKLLFERNAFDSTAVVNTASAVVFYSPTLIFLGGIAVLSKVYYSMKDTSTLMFISIGTIALNAVLDYILMKPMLHNGLVLSTSIVSAIQFFTAYAFLKRKIDISMDSRMLIDLSKVIIAALSMGGVLFVLKGFLRSYPVLISVGLSIIVGVSVYFAILIVLRVEEVQVVIEKLKSRRKEA